jgi:non-specific serine/threonine protein kinase
VDDEASAVRRRHAEHYAAMGEELVTALPGAGVEEAYASFEREHDNFRAALAFTRTPDLVELRLRLAAAVSHFWLVRGHLAEGRTWLDETLRLAQGHDMAPALHAALLRKLATLEWRQGDFDPADENAETALALLAGEVDENERWRLLILLGCIAYSRRESGRAGDWWQQSVDLARSLENDAHLSLALANLAVVLFERDDFRGAAGIYDESVDAARRADHREYLANALMGLGDARIRLGQYEEGRARLLESLDLYTKLGFHDRVASNCVWLAPAFEQDEDHATAARLLGAASGVRRRTGASLDWQEQEYLDALVSRLRAAAGSDVFEPAFGAGEAAPEDVVREVLSGSRPPS